MKLPSLLIPFALAALATGGLHPRLAPAADPPPAVPDEPIARKNTGSHYGHICRAQVRLTGVTVIDERDGTMRNDVYEMKKDPARKAEVAKLLAGRSATYPAKLEAGKWCALAVETAGDEMRVT